MTQPTAEPMWTPISDLRERLISDNGLACRCDAAWTERDRHAPACVEWIADAAVETFANWLRSEEAEALAMRGRRRSFGGLLTDLADALTRGDMP